MTDTAPAAAHDNTPASVVSNSTPALDHIRDTITSHLKTAQQHGRESLDAFRRIGEGLAEAKEILGHGAFGTWAKVSFPFSPQWLRRLMKLHREWADVARAFTWAEADGRTLGRREFSVDGALALAAEHRRAMAAPNEANDGDESESQLSTATEAPRKNTLRSRLEAAERERDEGRQQIAEMLATVQRLEACLAELTAAPRPGLVDTAAPRPVPSAASASAGEPPRVDPASKARAHKIAAMLTTEGTTEGERASARDRLHENAAKLKMPVADYLTACRLDPALVA